MWPVYKAPTLLDWTGVMTSLWEQHLRGNSFDSIWLLSSLWICRLPWKKMACCHTDQCQFLMGLYHHWIRRKLLQLQKNQWGSSCERSTARAQRPRGSALSATFTEREQVKTHSELPWKRGIRILKQALKSGPEFVYYTDMCLTICSYFCVKKNTLEMATFVWSSSGEF